MKYLRKFESHDAYASETLSDKPAIVWDNEHLHFIQEVNEDEDNEENEPTKYKLSVIINDLDFGEISTIDDLYAANDTINQSIEHLSTINYSYTVYNADTNEEIQNTGLSVSTYNNGFIISGTMPDYNTKIVIATSSLA